MTEHIPDQLCFSVEETRKRLKISRGLMYEAVRTGQVPSIRVGKRILIPRQALYRLLNVTTVAVNGDSETS